MPTPLPEYDLAKTPLDEAAILRTLNAFAVDVIAIPSAEDLFWYVAQNVVGRLNFLDCVIYQANDAGTELIQAAALGEKNPFGRSIINPLRITGDLVAHAVALDRCSDSRYTPTVRVREIPGQVDGECCYAMMAWRRPCMVARL